MEAITQMNTMMLITCRRMETSGQCIVEATQEISNNINHAVIDFSCAQIRTAVIDLSSAQIRTAVIDFPVAQIRTTLSICQLNHKCELHPYKVYNGRSIHFHY